MKERKREREGKKRENRTALGRLILFPQWNLIIYLRSLGFCSKFSYTLSYLTDIYPAIILTFLLGFPI